MFFTSWQALLRIVVVGVCSYAALVLLLRLSGKRTLAKFNAFDFVVTVALGSTLATVLLSRDTSLFDGIAAMFLLIGLQWIVAWLASRSERVDRMAKSQPRLLLYDGHFLPDALRAERLTEGEVLAAIRQHGIAAVEEVQAVVFETDGSMNVISRTEQGQSALRDVAGLAKASENEEEGKR